MQTISWFTLLLQRQKAAAADALSLLLIDVSGAISARERGRVGRCTSRLVLAAILSAGSTQGCASILGFEDGKPYPNVDASEDRTDATGPADATSGMDQYVDARGTTDADDSGPVCMSTSCGAGRLCCGGLCVSNDATHCYSCDTLCTGTMPVCSATLKACACSADACAAVHQDCDPTSGQCVYCKQRPGDAADFFVDRTFAGSPTGSQGCPFRTITAALTAANASTSAQKTIHIAAGTYDVGSAEQFPIQLRNGISLVGAGMSNTIIKGTGVFDHSQLGGALNGSYQVTVAMGDPTAINTISDVSLQAASSTVQGGVYGLLCDRGNSPPSVLNPLPNTFPVPNVTATRITVGPGYQYGVVVSSSDTDGCNLKLTASTISQNAAGVWAVGCGTGGGTSKTVAVQLGDGTAEGSNTMSQLVNGILPGFGCGVITWDCVSPIRILRNTIKDSECGMDLASHDPQAVHLVQDNTFSKLSRMGVQVGEAGILDTFTGNVMTGIGSDGALRLLKTAQIKKARNNQIAGNELGLVITGGSLGSRIIDFGSAVDPGLNTFSCNSSTSGGNASDVLLGLDAAGTASVFPARQNSWDHVPPTITGMASGTDVVNSSAAVAPTIDATGATSAGPCTSPHVSGP